MKKSKAPETSLDRSKKEIRRSIRKLRHEKSALTRKQEAFMFVKIMQMQPPLPLPLDSLHFGAYIPMQDEPDIMPLLEKIVKHPHSFSLPVPPTLWFPQTMPGKELSWFNGTGTGLLPSAVPPVGHEAKSNITPQNYSALREQGVEFSWLFIPALAVSADGYRLGQGGGYYDRFLAQITKDTAKIACIYDEEFYDSLPFCKQFDQTADYALTPKRLVRLKNSEH